MRTQAVPTCTSANGSAMATMVVPMRPEATAPVIATIRPPHPSETGADVIDVYLVLRYRRLLRPARTQRVQHAEGDQHDDGHRASTLAHWITSRAAMVTAATSAATARPRSAIMAVAEKAKALKAAGRDIIMGGIMVAAIVLFAGTGSSAMISASGMSSARPTSRKALRGR